MKEQSGGKRWSVDLSFAAYEGLVDRCLAINRASSDGHWTSSVQMWSGRLHLGIRLEGEQVPPPNGDMVQMMRNQFVGRARRKSSQHRTRACNLLPLSDRIHLVRIIIRPDNKQRRWSSDLLFLVLSVVFGLARRVQVEVPIADSFYLLIPGARDPMWNCTREESRFALSCDREVSLLASVTSSAQSAEAGRHQSKMK